MRKLRWSFCMLSWNVSLHFGVTEGSFCSVSSTVPTIKALWSLHMAEDFWKSVHLRHVKKPDKNACSQRTVVSDKYATMKKKKAFGKKKFIDNNEKFFLSLSCYEGFKWSVMSQQACLVLEMMSESAKLWKAKQLLEIGPKWTVSALTGIFYCSVPSKLFTLRLKSQDGSRLRAGDPFRF